MTSKQQCAHDFVHGSGETEPGRKMRESIPCPWCEIERLRETIRQLRKGLDDYGFHLGDCPAFNSLKACKCGWNDFDESAAMHDDRLPVETAGSPDEGFQARVHDWMTKCFARPDAMLPAQRSFRFIEEALELVQSSGTSREDVLRLVEYVYGRPAGVIDQEIGGVMVTLSGLATSFGLSMDYAGNAELARCEKNTEKIRAKDLAKPQRSPLPGLAEQIADAQRRIAAWPDDVRTAMSLSTRTAEKANEPRWDCRCDDPSCPYCGPRLAREINAPQGWIDDWAKRGQLRIPSDQVLTRVCDVCQTVHSGPLCPVP